MKKLTALVLFLFFPTTAFSASEVVINEFLPNPSSGNDWVELYNSSSDPIDIGTWYLRDAGTTTHMGDVTPGTTISAGGFFAIDVGSRLNKDSDTVTLYSNSNDSVDSRSYSSDPGTNVSVGRYPDGGDWVNLQTPTKDSTNSMGNPVPTPSPTPTPIPPTATPTPAPTSTTAPTDVPTPSPTPTTAVIATTIPTVKPTVRPTPTGEPLVLGEQTSEPTVLPTIHETAENQTSPTFIEKFRSLIPVILIVVGAALTIGSGVPLLIQEIRSRKKPV